ARRDREVVGRPACVAEGRSKRRVRRRVVIVTVDVAQPRGELGERLRIEPTVLGHAVVCTGLELVELPSRLRYADDWAVQLSAARHRLQGGKDLLVSEIAGPAEEDQRVGARGGHRFRSTWPPNSNRMAESRRSWNSASPRELKRSKSEAASTCAGTPSS